MQNRYTGDVGDFGKYGLLRALSGVSGKGSVLSLGMIWYMVPNETHNDDGKHIGFLEPTAKNLRQFRSLDTQLYDALARIVHGQERTVELVREASLFPPETTYYDVALSFSDMPSNGPTARRARLKRRELWLNGAVAVTRGCDLIFVDPDNGLEVKSRPHHGKGPKYVYYDDLALLKERGQSLVVYHHIGRSVSASLQIERRMSEIAERIDGGRDAFALHYHRGSARAFFVVPAASQRELLVDKSRRFLESGWGVHFDLIE